MLQLFSLNWHKFLCFVLIHPRCVYRNLEKFLFGKTQPKVSKVKSEDEESDSDESEVELSSEASSSEEDEDETTKDLTGKRHLVSSKTNKASKKRKPAWHDDDDDNFM